MTSSDDGTTPQILTVLVAEDDPFLREAIGSSLQASGFLVMAAESGDHAWPILKTSGIDVLVNDISMPGTRRLVAGRTGSRHPCRHRRRLHEQRA